MKSGIKILLPVLLLSCITWMAPQKASAQLTASFQLFYDDLSPYGDWVNYGDYGYVWHPDLGSGFTPYGSNGYWVFTDEGWTWYSNYSWGWAPFHYGRWLYEPYYGWLWIPDTEWGPGWVSWRRSEGYYGWAPIGPGISTDIAYSNSYYLPFDRWTFVRDRDFGRTNITNYYINNSYNLTIINNSSVINNYNAERPGYTRYNTGPDRFEVQTRTRNTIMPVSLGDRNSPGQNLNKESFQVYRPRMERNKGDGQRPAPMRVASLKVMKLSGQRNINTRSQKENQLSNIRSSDHQRIEQPVKQQPAERPWKNDQPVRQQPIERPRNDQPVKQQSTQRPRNDQPFKQQPVERPRNDQPVKQQPAQQKRNEQPAKPAPQKPKRKD